MANDDRVSELYFGRVLDAEAQSTCRDRVHWMCARATGTRVLDVGCSQGIVSIILGREGRSVVGIDLEQGPLEVAQRDLADEPPLVRERVEFRLADAFAVEFEPACFDTIIMGELLEHLATPRDLLARAAGWLRPGGRLVVSVPLGYHPYHDHKRSFYLAGLLDLLGEFFSVREVEVVGNQYLCAAADKPAAGQAPQPPSPEMLRRWAALCDQAVEKLQRKAYNDKLALQSERARLGEQLSATRAQLDQLRRTVGELQAQRRTDQAQMEALRGQLTRAEQRIAELARAEQRAKELEAKLSDAAGNERRLREACEAERRLRADVQAQYRRLKERSEYQIERATEQADRYRAELNLLYQGVRYRIGDAFVQAARSPLAALLLPIRLVKLFFLGLRRVRQRRAEARELAGGAPAARARDKAQHSAAPRRPSGGAPPAGQVAQVSAPAGSAGLTVEHISTLLPAYAPTPTDQIARPALKIAAVSDEFSWRGWQYEARLIPFTPKNWQEVLAAEEPELLLVESAWSGIENSWYFQIRDFGRRGDVIRYYALGEVVAWCRERGIPTVFYNKEDPPNFEVFVDAARLFDHVFTSDANCIPDYRKHLGHERIYALPFAAQPRIHNPVLTAERTGTVCFAGTWYRHRHLNRQESAEAILRPALEFGLDIFDRMANSDNENYRWPEVFQPAVRGALPYAQMLNAYKRYKVFVNINSVANSPTMFSRRVFELLACATPVVSSYALGIARLLGEDIVLMSRDEATTRALLSRLLQDDEYRDRLALRGLRKVMSAHTYGHRLNTILQTVGKPTRPVGQPRLTMIAAVETPEQVAAAWENFRRQEYGHKRLLLATPNPQATAALNGLVDRSADVAVVSLERAAWGRIMAAALDQAQADYVLALHPADYYGPHYLTDLALATLYVSDAAMGKASFYQATDGTAPRVAQPGREYRYLHEVCPWTLCLPIGTARQAAARLGGAQRPFEWWSRMLRAQQRVYSADRFNYVRQGSARRATEDVPAANQRFAALAAENMEPALA